MMVESATWLRGLPVTTTRIPPRSKHAAVADGSQTRRVKCDSVNVDSACVSIMNKALEKFTFSVECRK